MLVIKTTAGIEIRIPVDQVESIDQVEATATEDRPVPPHAYMHREGVNRCAACWRPRTHPSHVDQAVHS